VLCSKLLSFTPNMLSFTATVDALFKQLDQNKDMPAKQTFDESETQEPHGPSHIGYPSWKKLESYSDDGTATPATTGRSRSASEDSIDDMSSCKEDDQSSCKEVLAVDMMPVWLPKRWAMSAHSSLECGASTCKTCQDWLAHDSMPVWLPVPCEAEHWELGDRVKFRDGPSDEWLYGSVTKLHPFAMTDDLIGESWSWGNFKDMRKVDSGLDELSDRDGSNSMKQLEILPPPGLEMIPPVTRILRRPPGLFASPTKMLRRPPGL